MAERKKYVILVTALCIKLRLDPDLDRNQGVKNTRLLNRLLLTQTKKKKYKDRFYGYNSNHVYFTSYDKQSFDDTEQKKEAKLLMELLK